jgi:hypothetical protein
MQVIWNAAWLLAGLVVLVQVVRTPRASFVAAGLRWWMLAPFLFVSISYRGFGLGLVPLAFAWWVWMRPAIRRAGRAASAPPIP